MPILPGLRGRNTSLILFPATSRFIILLVPTDCIHHPMLSNSLFLRVVLPVSQYTLSASIVPISSLPITCFSALSPIPIEQTPMFFPSVPHCFANINHYYNGCLQHLLVNVYLPSNPSPHHPHLSLPIPVSEVDMSLSVPIEEVPDSSYRSLRMTAVSV